MGDRKAELLDEVSQLITQYRQEVPGRGRAWPKSIKDRVLELGRLGLETKELADRTGISYYTIFGWSAGRKAPPRFEPVAVVPSRRVLSKTSAVTVTKPRPRRRSPFRAAFSTVTVTMPGGIRIDGVDAELLKAILPHLTGGRR